MVFAVLFMAMFSVASVEARAVPDKGGASVRTADGGAAARLRDEKAGRTRGGFAVQGAMHLSRVLAIAAVATTAAAFMGCSPKVGPASSLVVEKNEALEARGAYLATHVAGCQSCHSVRDWSLFSGPVKPGSAGVGGEFFGEEQGFPGNFYASNLTPTALGAWTDGEIERAVVAGVSRDGRALFPLMPYRSYAKLCQEDVNALIAWTRSLKPRGEAQPPPDWHFPFNMIINNIPREQPRPACQDKSDRAAYGAYLANAAACLGCHRNTDQGKKDEEVTWAGGQRFVLEGGAVRASNITPHPTSGIGAWTEDMFVARFQAFKDNPPPKVAPGDMQSVMPWTDYTGMDEDDLRALYQYLRTVPAVDNSVARWTPGERG
jgi:mono/diheme cytochrome c family protein